MPEPIPVLVNRAGGTAAAAGHGLRATLDQAFAAAGHMIDLRLIDGCDIAATARSLRGHPRVIVGGGDGTLGCAVNALAGSGTTLGILPLGTHNHLARELGIPLDIAAAAAIAAGAATRRIDIARVNGHVFVNNASIGVYPLLVSRRDAERRARGLPKWLALVPAGWAALRRLRHHRLHLNAPGLDETIRTPLLFVGNNRYALDRGRLGTRTALDDGVLSVFAVRARSKPALIGFALRAAIGRADAEQDFAAMQDVSALTVTTHAPLVSIALDGEVTRLESPLVFGVQPCALTVAAPPLETPAPLH